MKQNKGHALLLRIFASSCTTLTCSSIHQMGCGRAHLCLPHDTLTSFSRISSAFSVALGLSACGMAACISDVKQELSGWDTRRIMGLSSSGVSITSWLVL
jgi:hypothetical protein